MSEKKEKKFSEDVEKDEKDDVGKEKDMQESSTGDIFKRLGINQDDIDRLDDFYKRTKKG